MVLFLVVRSIPVSTWSEEKENSLKVKIKVIENDGTITRIAPSSIESIKDNIGWINQQFVYTSKTTVLSATVVFILSFVIY